MDISIFLAKALGLYLVIVSLPCIFNAKNLQPTVNKFIKNEALLMLAAAVTLILGIILVLTHNVWATDWRVVITLLAWLTFFQGIVRFYFPTTVQKMVLSMQLSSYIIIGIITLLVGLFLLYHGFHDSPVLLYQ